mmetsp:Transcript_70091/g.194859  ORF Transcript_70091/g.194859 Transcript_70091/m.194859 type:complete len:609 (-) Transcript_70091:1456-3282(-)
MGFLDGRELLLQLGELLVLFRDLLVQEVEPLAVHPDLARVLELLCGRLRLQFHLVQLGLSLLQQVLELLDPGLHGLFLGRQLQLLRLQFLVLLAQLRDLLLRLLGLGHESAHLLGLLLQFLHLLLGRMHAPALLRHVDRGPEQLVHLLLALPAPSTLDLRSTPEELVLVGRFAPADAAAPGLQPDDLGQDRLIPVPLELAPEVRLELHRGHLALTLVEVDARLLAPEERLQVTREDANAFVHVPADLAPPVRLDDGRALDEQLQACELEALERLQFEENHCLTHSPSVSVVGLRDVELRCKVFEQFLRAQLLVVHMLEPRHDLRRCDDLVVVPALLVVDAHWVAGAAHLHHLQDTAVSQLLRHAFPVVQIGQVLRVRLDAPDEMRLRGIDDLHEGRQLVLELGRHGVFLLLSSSAHLLLGAHSYVENLGELHVALEHRHDELHAACANAVHDIVRQLILVLVQESVGAIVDRPSEVLDDEPGWLRPDLVEAAVALVLLDKFVAETLVGARWHSALLVEHRENTGALCLQEIHRVLIVGEVQRVPWDALALVDLLLELEDELVEELLETLVGEVDAQLLEGVHLEALETENVQDSDKELDVILVSDRKV